jgi:predicted type IV restriction endonuclease
MVEDLHRRYQEDGLGVTSFTRVNRSSSDDRVELFIREKNLSFPVLKDSGKAWSYFEARGTPFIVLLSDGRVVWKSYGSSNLSSGLVNALIDAHSKEQGST